MALETVGHVVAALADSYATALECYAGWRRRQRAHNHYRTKRETASNDDNKNEADEGAKSAGPAYAAASASLILSKLQIEEAFCSGVDVLGDEFISGDGKTRYYFPNPATCRDVLLENLARLRDCVAALEQAVKPADSRPLPLAEITRVSEAVRIACLDALHKQYQRIVVGRLAPREQQMSPPASTPKLAGRMRDEGVVEGGGDEAEVDNTVAQISDHNRASLEKLKHNSSNNHSNNNNGSNSNNSSSNCDPPSPPPTPTQRLSLSSKSITLIKPDTNAAFDTESTYSWSTAAGSSENAQPKNSVFSVFCPEAMKYQVDLDKTLPVNGARCRCGYVWDAGCRGADRTAMVIKDGFQITPRFLGKSHCDKGLGCVLCTSSGKTETFGSVEGLKTHINSSHTKWQLLHDRDLAGR
ncbi:hypothetical protein F5Y09DRAFT_334498 [Xylaria sp. FL1042]|nr:hypothetical protein F5Y09DRAFT_334498 [Xylaria sp. FL1042]